MGFCLQRNVIFPTDLTLTGSEFHRVGLTITGSEFHRVGLTLTGSEFHRVGLTLTGSEFHRVGLTLTGSEFHRVGLTLTGSEFHRVGAATKKALVLTVVITLGTKSRLELDDRSCLVVNSECKYAGCLDGSA